MSLMASEIIVISLLILLISTSIAEKPPKSCPSSSSSSSSIVIISGNSTILSENKTFELGFFKPNYNGVEPRWYLGIWYASIPTPTYVWVANRESPVKNLDSSTVEIIADGKLAVRESGCDVVWDTGNGKSAVEVKLLEEGNLVLFDAGGGVVWQSFDFPTDTWLPGMNLTTAQSLICWKSENDPAPGKYSLRLKPPEFGEIELVFGNSQSYWSTGNWTGYAFAGVPEMTVPYIYRFHFTNPFTPAAVFGYTEAPLETGTKPPLTRFHVDYSGQVKQYTWSPQTEYWNMFWSEPENACKVYGLCGNLGFCNSKSMVNPCSCLPGFQPTDQDFSGGCRRNGGESSCSGNDGFEEIDSVSFNAAIVESFSLSRSSCESKCLSNCSCIALSHNPRTNLCKIMFDSILNLRNSSLGLPVDDTLYVRVDKSGIPRKNRGKQLIFIGSICGSVVMVFTMLVTVLFILRRNRIRRMKEEEESVFLVMNLRVFSYKELQVATNGFSEQLGHGGFGVVFHGELPDSSLVAVKRLERPGGGEKEFRAEVCTIGNIQHVNLVRLRGFCSENLHRLLVYDYMPNGPLSLYLKKDGQILNWDARFRVAIGTARGIAYLHEECRNCIIHCDIKPENILLDEDFSAKVSDFGLAKLLGRDFSRVLVTMRGTWGYVAPEWISGVAITTKADVYSYGMTLLEILGGRRNVEGPPSLSGGAGGGIGGGNNEKWFFPPWAARKIIEGNVEAVIDDRLNGCYNSEEAERAALVAVWCIQDEEGMRPTMGMVVKMLEGVVEVSVPPPPKLLQALVSGDSFQGVTVDSGNKLTRGGGGAASTGDLDNEIAEFSHDSKDTQFSV